MFLVDKIILVGAALALIAIGFGRLATQVGMPLLVLFVGVGMLAGSEGLGLAFENYELAHAVGTVALSVILFDGGLRTRIESFKRTWKPASVLATLGVLLTTILVGLAATLILQLTLLEGMLLGAIVGSTDAAAVFAALRGKSLDDRVARTLEVESGSNDPMAVFLTVGLLEVLLGQASLGPELLGLLLLQMGVGALVGFAVGHGAAELINRINLDSAGLYPVLTATIGLFAFGLAATIGGSGFLAVYLAGIVLGDRPIVFRRGIMLFHDGMAWLAQIAMFIILGLLSFPSRLVDVAPQGLAIAAILVFVARPAAVWICLLPFGFSWRETVFIAWAGLKGAVPVILATYPLLLGLTGGSTIFDVVFFVVFVSAVFQGSTMLWLARKVGLLGPPAPAPPVSLEISALKHLDGDIVEYDITPSSPANDLFIRDLGMPDGAVIALIARGSSVIAPRGSTRIQLGDHVFVLGSTALRPVFDHLFGGGEPPQLPPDGLDLQGHLTLEAVARLYRIELEGDPNETLDVRVRRGLGVMPVQVGFGIDVGPARLEIRETRGELAKRVRVILPRAEP